MYTSKTKTGSKIQSTTKRRHRPSYNSHNINLNFFLIMAVEFKAILKAEPGVPGGGVKSITHQLYLQI